MVERLSDITIEDAKITFKNFSGREDQYNRAGNRNFAVLLPTDQANLMEADGWNIKWLAPREEGDEPTGYIPVQVSFDNQPPQITTITSVTGNRTNLSEDMVEILDYADIEMIDLIINPYHWTFNEKQGVKAYLKKMFVTIREDYLDQKYATKNSPVHSSLPPGDEVSG